MDSEARGWLRDAALVALLGTGFLSFTGFRWIRLYYRELAVPPESLVFPPQIYFQASFYPIAPAIFLYAFLGFAVLVAVRTKLGSRLVRFDVLALLAVTALLSGLILSLQLAYRNGMFSEEFDYFFFAAFMFLISIFSIRWVWRERIWPLIQADQGNINLVSRSVARSILVIFFFWTIAAGSDGSLSAMDLMDGCIHDEVTFIPIPPGLESKSYVHVLHNDGRYYVRDPDLEPNSPTFVVLDSEVASAQLTRQGASC